MESGGVPADIHARDMKRRLWRNAWLAAAVVYVVSWLYQLAAGEGVNWYTAAKALAGAGGVLIAASFALSGFCYYFDFLDTKLGYRKYLGLVGFYLALAYAAMLVVLYPAEYGWGLWARLGEPEVLLGIGALAILAFMAAISSTRMMQFLGPGRWRVCLRLGYAALVLFIIRAYLLEHEQWLDWFTSGSGLPPGRLVLSIIDAGVITLRGSMIMSQFMRKRESNALVKPASTSRLFGGSVALWLVVALGLVAVAGVYAGYRYLGLRPVVPPALPAAEPQNGEPAPLPEPNGPGVTTSPVLSDPELSFLKLPPGFAITIFADDWAASKVSSPGPGTGPRLMTVRAGAVYVAIPREGRIAVMRDTDADGRADSVSTFIDGLNRPHNITFNGATAYVAATDAVWTMRDNTADHVADEGSVRKLLTLPSGGGHWTRTAKVWGDKLFIAVGSSCNVCNEQNELRAAITSCELDGTGCATYARGLRNTVDFVEYQGQLYGTDNGRDYLGNALPPEEVNQLVDGGNYGWPICYGQNVHDTDFDKNQYVRDPCADMRAPLVELPAHNAPLGLDFYRGNDFPADYQGDLFVAAHGSWNRQPPDGYKIFRVDWQTKAVSDFITGWYSGGTVRGRPVGVVNYEGGLLISDDTVGLIYFVRYAGE